MDPAASASVGSCTNDRGVAAADETADHWVTKEGLSATLGGPSSAGCPFSDASHSPATVGATTATTTHCDFVGPAAGLSPGRESGPPLAAANAADAVPAVPADGDKAAEAAAVVDPAAGRLATTFGKVTVEELWAHLVKGAVPASAPIPWPPLTQIYQEVMGSGYKNIVHLRHDVKSDAKRLCARGVVALAEIEWRDGCAARWSGLFGGPSSGVGLLRLSTACNPPFAKGGGSLPAAMRSAALVAGSLRDANLFPCVALKFPRGGGASSANLLFAGKKTGQREEHFFARPVCTAVTEKTPFLMKPMLQALRKHSEYPTHMGLSDVAANGVDGARCAGRPRFPWALILAPTPEASGDAEGSSSAGHPGGRFLTALPESTTFAAGRVLYDVFAAATPHACEGPKHAKDPQSGLLRVGRLVLRSRFVRTAEDDKIVFWHQIKEEDYELRPEWRAAHGDKQREQCGADDFSRLIAARQYTDI